jgi:hypothetical protein
MTLLINVYRFKEDFDQLAQIGSTGDGGAQQCRRDLHSITQWQ